MDRTALILDIFAEHARSREGHLQVELAQIAYQLPRLRGAHPGAAAVSALTGEGVPGLRETLGARLRWVTPGSTATTG